MNRRSFLGLSSLAVAGMVLDPERALWIPGRKVYCFVSQPVRRLSIAELVAVTYEKVVMERKGYGDLWSDNALLRYLERGEPISGEVSFG